MKIFYLAIILSLSGINTSVIQNDLELQILDKTLVDGERVNVVIKNNSKNDYCFVMDTVFYERDRPGFDPSIQNVKIILLDKSNKEVPLLREIYTHDEIPSFNDNEYAFKQRRAWSDPFKIIILKSGKTIKLKVPFDLVVSYKYINEPAVFQIEKNKQYKGRVEYMIKNEYFEKYISEYKIDSLKKKGYKFFTGSLKSNKIPLVFKK